VLNGLTAAVLALELAVLGVALRLLLERIS